MRPLFESQKFQFISITKQADEFLKGLDQRHWDQFQVAARVLATSFLRGATPAGRSERITGQEAGMFELKLNLPGSPGPARRLICFRDGRRILIARGLEKRRRRLPAGDIEIAAREISAWREARSDERSCKGKARKRRGKEC